MLEAYNEEFRKFVARGTIGRITQEELDNYSQLRDTFASLQARLYKDPSAIGHKIKFC